MRNDIHRILSTLVAIFLVPFGTLLASSGMEQSKQEAEQVLKLIPDLKSGKTVYFTCAVCHRPEGWGDKNGYYPQIAGQLKSVIIKQLADIRARNRDTPTMLPFARLDILTLQEMADVAAYISQLPMTSQNGTGSASDLEYGEKLYTEYCSDCHEARGEGDEAKQMPLIQGQHYEYLIRQFDWIRSGKRRNADKEMVEQIEKFEQRDVEAIMDYVSRLRPPREKLATPGWKNPDFPDFHFEPIGPTVEKP